MWETQARKFTISKKVNVYFCLPEFCATKIFPFKCQVDNKTNIKYDMILGRDLLTALRMDLKFSETLLLVMRSHMKGVRYLTLT